MDTEIERLIAEVVEEHADEVLAAHIELIKKQELERKKAEDAARAEREAVEKRAEAERIALERKQSAERKEYGQAIETALKLQSETLAEASKKAALTMADAIGQIAKTLGAKTPAPNYRFEIIRDEQGRISEVIATKN